MLKIEKVVTGYLEENCYISYNEDTRALVLVDPGDDPKHLIKKISDTKLNPEAILLTHGHFDHVGAVSEILKNYPDFKVYVHKDEEPVLKSTNELRGMSQRKLLLDEIRYLKDGESFVLAGETWRIMHTPGHTMGSSCYYLPEYKILFSGDTLFKDTCGRTDLDTGDPDAIINSIQNVIMDLPDETKVLPGHGPETTVGIERRNNFIMHM